MQQRKIHFKKKQPEQMGAYIFRFITENNTKKKYVYFFIFTQND